MSNVRQIFWVIKISGNYVRAGSTGKIFLTDSLAMATRFDSKMWALVYASTFDPKDNARVVRLVHSSVRRAPQPKKFPLREGMKVRVIWTKGNDVPSSPYTTRLLDGEWWATMDVPGPLEDESLRVSWVAPLKEAYSIVEEKS